MNVQEKPNFLVVLDKAQRQADKARKRIDLIRGAYLAKQFENAYDQALRMEENAERFVLWSRVLPAYTGCPSAFKDVDAIIEQEVPVEIGFTEQGWFSVRLPMLLPKKAHGTSDYVRRIMFSAMKRFFQDKLRVRYRGCVLIYRHVYTRERPDRQKRDHDNIEINEVSDIVAFYTMPDDGPGWCNHYYCSAVAGQERTEVYVVPNEDFAEWLVVEKSMPDEGVRLYESRENSSENDM